MLEFEFHIKINCQYGHIDKVPSDVRWYIMIYHDSDMKQTNDTTKCIDHFLFVLSNSSLTEK